MSLTWLASFLGGPLINGLITAYKTKLDAANTRDAMTADLAGKAILAEIEAYKAGNALIVAEQGRWYTAIIRPLFALPLIIFVWKVIVWDKVLGWGTTDQLMGDVSTWAGYIIVAYFGGRSVEKVTRTIVGAFRGR